MAGSGKDNFLCQIRNGLLQLCNRIRVHGEDRVNFAGNKKCRLLKLGVTERCGELSHTVDVAIPVQSTPEA